MTIKKDYSKLLCKGPGDTDYARYMRTDALLSLQPTADEMEHRDELLFQIVHQSTELWLKLSCNELQEAIHQTESGHYGFAAALLRRSSYAIQLITDQLNMLKFMTPWDFQAVRPALGNGSGFESPGWKKVQSTGEAMCQVFENTIASESIDIVDVYRSHPNSDLFQLFEALVEWDEKVSLWRSHHYKIAVRTIGLNTIGTKGTPIEKLTRLINQEFFPMLWRARTRITNEETYGS